MAASWYYVKNNQRVGPVVKEQLQQLIASGQISPSDLVWTDGMANWLAAQQVQGLVPANAAVSVQPAPASRGMPLKTDSRDERGSRPERRPRDEYENDFEERRPRRRRPKKKSGAGLWIGLGIGGVLLLVVVCGGFCFFIYSVGNSNSTMEGTRNWSLNTSSKTSYHIYMKKGYIVELRVNSTGRSDMDLFVYDGTRKVRSDTALSSNCFIAFEPRTSKTYKVEIWNRLLEDRQFGRKIRSPRNGRNSGTFTYKHIKRNKIAQKPPIADPNKDKDMGQPKEKPPIGQPPVNNPAGRQTIRTYSGTILPGSKRTYTMSLTANTTYTIETSSSFDSYLELHDIRNRQIAFDDDSAEKLDARIVYRPTQSGIYRITVRGFDRNHSGRFTLKVMR